MTEDADFPARFGTVAIVGVGLIGGSLGQALKARRLAGRVVGVGRSAERLEAARRLGAIDAGATDLKTGLQGADVVVLCTTVGHLLETLPDVLAAAPPQAVITDVGSTKSEIVRRAGGHPGFVGGHPMAGSEQTGVEAATPLLFQDATWAVTPGPSSSERAVKTVRRLAQEVGARTLDLTPEAHDAMVAVTSHLPHVIANAFMRHAASVRAAHPQTARLAAGSFADMTRIAASSPELWRDVCLSNREAVLAAIKAFRAEVDRLEAAVADRDGAAMEALFAEGAAAKRGWGGE